MDLRVIKYFIAVADCRNFSKASELLHISQPTLSRQIALLEEEIGIPLFVRSKPAISLTLAGEIFLEESKDILERYDAMIDRLTEVKKGNIGSMSIGYVNLSQFKILSKAIHHIHEEYPDIKLAITQMSLPEVQEAILQRKLDIGFDMRINIAEEDKVDYKKITNSILYAVVSRRHKFAKRDSISLAELKGEDIVIYERRQAPELFDSMILLCSQHGFTPNFTQFGEDMESVMMMAGLGQGIALMDETAKILETEHTIFIPVNDCEVYYNWYLSWHIENDNPSLKKVIDSISLEHDLNFE